MARSNDRLAPASTNGRVLARTDRERHSAVLTSTLAADVERAVPSHAGAIPTGRSPSGNLVGVDPLLTLDETDQQQTLVMVIRRSRRRHRLSRPASVDLLAVRRLRAGAASRSRRPF
jgi:hypothetical protein